MKAIHIALILLLAVAAPAAYVIFRPAAPPSDRGPVVMVAQMGNVATQAEPLTNAAAAVEHQEPVQPLEDRGDAMLFEIEALQNMPFDQSITMPFD